MSKVSFLMFAVWGAMQLSCASASVAAAKRPASIADSIELRKFGSHTFDEDGPIVASPDGTKYVFVVRNGNLEANRNEYALYLLETPSVKRAPSPPREILRLTSQSNHSAIEDLSWAKDGTAIVFYGDGGNGKRRAYKFRLSDGKLEGLTPPDVDVLSFAISEDHTTVAYVAKAGPKPSRTDAEKQAGILLDRVDFFAITTGPDRSIDWPSGEVVLMRDGKQRKFPLPFATDYNAPALLLSPDGTYLLLEELARTDTAAVPAHWAPLIDKGFNLAVNYWVMSADTGAAQRLIDAPRGFAQGFAWTSDHTAMIGTKLPVGEGDPAQHYLVEIDLRTGSRNQLTSGTFDHTEWDAERQVVNVTQGRASQGQLSRAAFRKQRGQWKRVAVEPATRERARPFVEQGMNLPPRLVWQRANGAKSVLLDPNPQLRELALGEARAIAIPLADGKRFLATLYVPEDWHRSGSYPAVLQTYFRDPTRFTMDGNDMTSGMSARALAARGMVVVQLDHPDTIYPETTSTPDEAPVAAAVLDEVVRELVRNYGVDPARVGIFGFSRSGIFTRYALANSTTYAAAVESDAWFIGYVTRILMHDIGRTASDPIIGALPTGDGLKIWLERAAAFSAHRISAPLLVMNFGNWSDIVSIEEKVAMQLANKPAEFVSFPTAVHNPVRPAERFAVQSRFIDWFRFWLQGYEDPDPKKAEQYLRWRELRKQRDANRAAEASRYSSAD